MSPGASQQRLGKGEGLSKASGHEVALWRGKAGGCGVGSQEEVMGQEGGRG